MLADPALLCVVARKLVGFHHTLCLSPLDKRKGRAWTPLKNLKDTPEALEYYLRELKLLGGLCCGHNGLTLQTVRALYPFPLCMEIISTHGHPCELRAAICVLVRQLYVEAHTRELRPLSQSVWDWDALLA